MPKGPQGQKRPADVIGAAIRAAKIATGEIEEELLERSAAVAPQISDAQRILCGFGCLLT